MIIFTKNKEKEIFNKPIFKDSYFILTSSKDNKITIVCPKDLSEVQYDNNFALYLFRHPKYNSESYFFKVNYNENCCGFLFPINRLITQENEFIKFDENIDEETEKLINRNNYFKFIVYSLLLNCDIYIDDLDCNREYKITDLFDDNYWVLLIEKDLINKREDGISRFIPCLYKYGFILGKNVNYHYFKDISYDETIRNILLKEVCFSLKDNPYIKILFEKLLPIEKSNLAIFLMLYQIIEMYFCYLREFKVKKAIKEFDCKLNQKIEINSLKNKICDPFKEIKLINNLLSSKYIKNEVSEIRNLLFENNKVEEEEGNNPLYSFRNKIIHNYYSFFKNQNNEAVLKKVNQVLEDLIINLLLTQPINLEDQIREKAYFLSIDNPKNSPEENWLESERQILK